MLATDTDTPAEISDAQGAKEQRWVRVVRPLGYLLVAAWSLLVLIWAALHWAILPHIDRWREPIEQRASRMLGHPVRIGEIIVTSGGLAPALELRNVEISDAQGELALRLPRVIAALSVHALLTQQNLFEQLVIDGAYLEMRRDKAGRLFVAGLDFNGPGEGDQALANWFFDQHEFAIRGGTLRWVDELHSAAPLTLADVRLVVRNSLLTHEMRIDATPPPEWGERFTLMAQFKQPLLADSGDWKRWQGTAYAEFPRADVGTLRQHATLPFDLDQGQGALRAWVQLDDGRAQSLALDVALRDVSFRLRPGLEPLLFSEVTGRLSARQTDTGSEFAASRFGFLTGDGVRWPASNITLSLRQQADGRVSGGELSAERLDIALMSRLTQRLPVDAAIRERLNDLDPQGIAEGLSLRWDDAPAQPPGARSQEGELPAHYKLRVSLKGLALNAKPAPQPDQTGRPGVQQADVELNADERGGDIRASMINGSLDLPGVLEEALLPLDRLSAQMSWRIGVHAPGEPPPVTVQIKGLQFANADLQADLRGSWSTGGSAAQPDTPRFPGLLDIDGTLKQVVGTRVVRYLPQSMVNSRSYVSHAVRSGSVPELAFRVKGDLNDFPFEQPRDGKQGDFNITAQVEGLNLAYVPSRPAVNGQPAYDSPWPVFEDLGCELIFDRDSMEIRNAQGRLQGIRLSGVRGGIKSLSHHSVVQLEGAGRAAVADMLRFMNESPLGAWTGHALSQATASGNAELKLALSIPVDNTDASTVRGSVALGGGELRLRPDLPALGGTRGRIDFTQKGLSIVGGAARALGGDVAIDGGLQPDGSMRFVAQGTATAEGLRRSGDGSGSAIARVAAALSGQTPYRVGINLLHGKTELLVTSNLVGLASDLPAPFHKAAEASLPLRFQLSPVVDASGPARDSLRLDLGSLLQLQYLRDVSGDTARVLRGGVGVLEPAPQPASGVAATINLGKVNVESWERLLDGMKLPASSGPASTPGDGAGYFPTSIGLRVDELQYGSFRWNHLVAGLSQDGPWWRANLDAEQASGYLEYRPPRAGAGSAGRIYARLSRLSLPRAGEEGAPVENLLSPNVLTVPGLDVVVEDFNLRGKSLGRLELEAVNRQAGDSSADSRSQPREWRLTKLALTTPEARLSASGTWVASAAPTAAALPPSARRVEFDFKLDLNDSGALLQRLGYGKVLRGGKGAMTGQLAWLGSPMSLDFPSLSGQINMAIASGQFLKVEPGVGRLLGVLSLQALPRRLTLDFRDVFDKGFAFDDVTGDVQIAQGLARTSNLRMRGVQAVVLMEGQADVDKETQDLRVAVIPEISAGGAALAVAAINPAIGLASFLAQYVLGKPLAAANTREFSVTGTWADPKVDQIDRKSGSVTPAAAAQPASVAPVESHREKP
jgi:uncharacterized protein (TIGR02099 family)